VTTVLVADDDPAVRALIVRCLLRAGHRVVAFSDGDEVVQSVAALAPDIVVMDVSMPGLTGLEVCRLLRESRLRARLPIILVSANSANEDVRLAVEAGANAYLTKPFSPAALVAAVQHALETR
jgi:two-component system phosphate regulon response regulator PhoB